MRFNNKLTRDEALRIQAEQVDHYAAHYGDWVRAAVAQVTYDWLLPDGEIDVIEVNRRIPRGGCPGIHGPGSPGPSFCRLSCVRA